MQIGELRPSQLIYTFGVGSLIDLPHMSALVMGLDDWNTSLCKEVTEERLLSALQNKKGPQLKRLLLPPLAFDDFVANNMAAQGVPVAPVPRWLRCPLCDTLATIDSGAFRLQPDNFRPDRTRYVHAGCHKAQHTQPPTALPVRFLVACRNGHLSDFPWIEYVHKNKPVCRPSLLTLREYGIAGDASDIIAECKSCGANRRMADAFDSDDFRQTCRGVHPHLRHMDTEACQEEAKTILLGASNSWFPMVTSALTVPPRESDKLANLIEQLWTQLKDIESLEVTKYATAPIRMPLLAEFEAKDIWKAIEKKRTSGGIDEAGNPDLKVAEWEVLISPKLPSGTNDFTARRVAPPEGYESHFSETILLERLREVRALTAFTRIESKGDFTDTTREDDGRGTPLGRHAPEWLPVSEVRGEGIFLRFREEALQNWESQAKIRVVDSQFRAGNTTWRKLRKLQPATAGYPGIRFVLIHSLAHALMRQITLECGYTSASVRERIYCSDGSENKAAMAGLMIYTAASDSEGTLGGLVQLGHPKTLGRLLDQALEEMRLCASDPLCSEHEPMGDGRTLHGACCHACLFAPETSCEKGNRFLDRTTLVETFAQKGAEFFPSKETC